MLQDIRMMCVYVCVCDCVFTSFIIHWSKQYTDGKMNLMNTNMLKTEQ